MAYEAFSAVKLEDGRYEITASAPGGHMAYWSTFPNGFCDDNEVGAFDDSIVFDDPAPGERIYFHIMTGSNYSVCAPRLWMIPSLPNLRELGGYETADGTAFVKYGAFYRADRLCALSEAGRAAFAKLGIKLILDFRVPDEINGFEDPVFDGVEHLIIPPISQDSECFHFSFKELMAGDIKSAVAARESLRNQYRYMAFGSDAYRTMFARIADGAMPILFHCSAGKDRTGVAAALILLLLGVPRETIVHDYMLTRISTAQWIGETFEKLESLIGGNQEVHDAIESFVSVRQEGIESTVDEILARYPDVDEFFIKEMAMTPAQIAAIRSDYLTKHIEKEG